MVGRSLWAAKVVVVMMCARGVGLALALALTYHYRHQSVQCTLSPLCWLASKRARAVVWDRVPPAPTTAGRPPPCFPYHGTVQLEDYDSRRGGSRDRREEGGLELEDVEEFAWLGERG